MQIDWGLVKDVAVPIVAALIGGAAVEWFQRRPRLRTSLEHASGITMQAAGQPPMTVNTHTLVLTNAGRKTETNVRLGHRNVQFWYQVHPPGLHAERPLPDGGREIVFDRLTPKTTVWITYLYFAPVLWQHVNLHIEGDSGNAKVVPLVPTPLVSGWVKALLWTLLASGVGMWLYVAMVAARSLMAD